MDLDLAQLDALAAAVTEGTFDAAAKSLHVTPSAVSQRIKALEHGVGRVLLIRTRPVRPTTSGEAVLRLARQVRTARDDLAKEIGGADDAVVTLPLAVNADSLDTWLLPAVAAVGTDVTVDIRRADQADTAEMLRDGRVMAAVTSAAQAVPGCMVTRLGTMRYRPRASGAFAARWFPGGGTVEELAAAPVVVYDRADDLQDGYLRRRTRRRLSPPRHFVPSSAAFVLAVRLGLGWGMLPDQQVGPGDGLVELAGAGVDVRLYWQQWRLRSAALDRLTAAVRSAAAEQLG